VFPIRQGRGWARPLRGTQLAWLASSCHARHVGAGLSGGPACQSWLDCSKQTEQKESRQGRHPPLVALSVQEIRALIVRLLLPCVLSRAAILAWSTWRRTHQAIARRCHYRKRQSPKMRL